MYEAHFQIGKGGLHGFEGIHRGLQLQHLGFFDERANPVRLRACFTGMANAFNHLVAARIADQLGDDRCAARRQFINDRYIQIGKIAHRQSARDRRGAHHQLMCFLYFLCLLCLFPQRQPLAHAKAMLLVNNSQAQIGE